MPASIKRVWSGSRVSSRVTIGVGTGALAAAGLGAAVAAGVFASAPAANASPQSDPVSSAMISAITSGSSAHIVPVAAAGAQSAATAQPSGTVSESAAETAAIAGLGRPGTQVLGASLAYATMPVVGSNQIVWLVSLDPAGGMVSVGSPAVVENYVVAIVNAQTGKWVMTAAGKSTSLPALPVVPQSAASATPSA